MLNDGGMTHNAVISNTHHASDCHNSDRMTAVQRTERTEQGK